MIRPSVLLLAALLTAPALYRAFVTGDLDITSALTRYVLAVAVSAVMLAGLRMVIAGYGRSGPAVPLVTTAPLPLRSAGPGDQPAPGAGQP